MANKGKRGMNEAKAERVTEKQMMCYMTGALLNILTIDDARVVVVWWWICVEPCADADKLNLFYEGATPYTLLSRGRC